MELEENLLGSTHNYFTLFFKISAALFMWAWGLIINAFHLQRKSLKLLPKAKKKNLKNQKQTLN